MSDSAVNHNEESFEFDCPECGTHISGEVDRCPKCGVEFVIEEVSEAECPDCHATVPTDSERCPNCGLMFSGPEESKIAEAAAEEAEVVQAGAVVEEAIPGTAAEETVMEAPAEETQPEEVPAESSQKETSPDNRLKEEFSELVGRVKPLLTLAKDFNIDATAARRLIDKAVNAGKSREVESAVKTLRECLDTLDKTIGDHLDREMADLESLAEVAKRADEDPVLVTEALEAARTKRAEGNIEGALSELRNGKRHAEQLTGPYAAAQEMYKALEDLVQSSERFFLDVREARRLLNESKEAGEGGDWSTMAALARQGREELARALPEAIKKEIQEAKQYLLEAKARGTDVAASVKLLKDAGTAVKRQRYEEALAWLGEFKAEQKGL